MEQVCSPLGTSGCVGHPPEAYVHDAPGVELESSDPRPLALEAEDEAGVDPVAGQ